MFHLVTTRFRDNRPQPIALPPVCVASATLPDVAGNNGEVCDCVGFARERNVSKGTPCRLPLRGKSLMSSRGAASNRRPRQQSFRRAAEVLPPELSRCRGDALNSPPPSPAAAKSYGCLLLRSEKPGLTKELNHLRGVAGGDW